MLVSWFPLTTVTVLKCSDSLQKKSGISRYSCLLEPGTLFFTSPRTMSLLHPSDAAMMASNMYCLCFLTSIWR